MDVLFSSLKIAMSQDAADREEICLSRQEKYDPMIKFTIRYQPPTYCQTGWNPSPCTCLAKKNSLHWNRPTPWKTTDLHLPNSSKPPRHPHLLIIGLVPHDLWRHEAIRAALACEPVPADPESSFGFWKSVTTANFTCKNREREILFFFQSVSWCF